MYTRYSEITPFITKDGSEIRELMHPGVHGNKQQSLAEATLAVGAATLLHQHYLTEEIYHFTAGCGRMTLGGRVIDVAVGDTVCIAPGTPHCLENTGTQPLRLLCCCSPPYSHDDTELLVDLPDENDGG
jgi:mannose-6-phosphate isomerase-like protein (cupin superfamily)